MSNENEVITRGILRSELKKELDTAFEKFAVIVNGAFTHQQKYMDKKFGEIDARFDRVELRLDRVENRLDKVEYKVDELQDEMQLVTKHNKRTEKRIEKLEVAAAI